MSNSDYDKTLLFWKSKNIQTDAELSEVLNGYRVSFAYNSGNLENEHII